MTDSKTRGKNIKLFDKIKLQHVQTNFRIHSLNHEWRNGSYNQAVRSHKAMDETDWQKFKQLGLQYQSLMLTKTIEAIYPTILFIVIKSFQIMQQQRNICMLLQIFQTKYQKITKFPYAIMEKEVLGVLKTNGKSQMLQLQAITILQCEQIWVVSQIESFIYSANLQKIIQVLQKAKLPVINETKDKWHAKMHNNSNAKSSTQENSQCVGIWNKNL